MPKTSRVGLPPILSTFTLSLLGLAACEAERGVADEADEADELRVFGDVTYGPTCTPELVDFHQDALRFGRIAASTPAFEQCIAEAYTVGLPQFQFGPYQSCAGEPFASAPLQQQIDAALQTARSANDLAVECSGGIGNASTAQNSGFDHTLAESFSWSTWLAGRPAVLELPYCDGAPGPDCRTIPWPYDQAANIIWHEAAHTHGYSHGANDQANALVACGRTSTPYWHFQVNTAPYIIGGCIGAVLDQTGNACGDPDTCDGDAILIVDEFGGDTCSCVADPASGHLWTGAFGSDPSAGGWGATHPRLVARVDADAHPDVVGFGHNGVSLAPGQADGFGTASLVVADFGEVQGWNTSQHLRTMADVDGDGRSDIVGFGAHGVSVARARGTAFEPPALWVADFGTEQGWQISQHVRVMADVTGDGRDDVVGFGGSSVLVAVSLGDHFAAPQIWSSDFAVDDGWSVTQHPRLVADVDGDGDADIVGFGASNVLLARSTGTGFAAPQAVLSDLTVDAGWTLDHPRMLARVDDDPYLDIVAFGTAHVYVSFGNAAGFTLPTQVSSEFIYNAGWRTARHPRMLDDMNGDGLDDIVAFGNDGVFVALANGAGYSASQFVVSKMGYAALGGSYRVGTHPRTTAALDETPGAELVGFGPEGVWVYGLGWRGQ